MRTVCEHTGDKAKFSRYAELAIKNKKTMLEAIEVVNKVIENFNGKKLTKRFGGALNDAIKENGLDDKIRVDVLKGYINKIEISFPYNVAWDDEFGYSCGSSIRLSLDTDSDGRILSDDTMLRNHYTKPCILNDIASLEDGVANYDKYMEMNRELERSIEEYKSKINRNFKLLFALS